MKRGLGEEEEPADAYEVAAARRASEEEIDDDREREGRARHAARTIGAWLQPLVGSLENEIAEIDDRLATLGLREDGDTVSDPIADTRFERLIDVIRKRVRAGKKWRNDERLIVFIEYKTTLDILERRLRSEFKDADHKAIRVLYGSGEMDDKERKRIKAAFNDPDDPVRVLIATDAASEGLNLHESARYILHYDIPWNPSRLEQRNGRLDRHGQARDVYVHHFTSEDDADLKFVAHVVRKVHEIREDLGSMGEVFDAAFELRFQGQEETDEVIESLDRNVRSHGGRAAVPVTRSLTTGTEHLESLRALWEEIDLSPDTLRDTLEAALGLDAGHPRLEGPDAEGRMKLVTPLPPRWEPLIDDTLRLGDGLRGPLPKAEARLCWRRFRPPLGAKISRLPSRARPISYAHHFRPTTQAFYAAAVIGLRALESRERGRSRIGTDAAARRQSFRSLSRPCPGWPATGSSRPVNNETEEQQP